MILNIGDILTPSNINKDIMLLIVTKFDGKTYFGRWIDVLTNKDSKYNNQFEILSPASRWEVYSDIFRGMNDV